MRVSNQNVPDIEIKNLFKSYGTKKVLNGISFSVDRGEVMGFLGANGAGKSTTMNILTGYISSDKGLAKICGSDILANPKEVKSNIGYLPEIPPLYPDMTVLEYLKFVFDLKKVKGDKAKHIQQILDKVKIDDVKNRLIKNLSKGYRQRVGLAQALVGNPRVLILDEPTVGLDPVQIMEFRNIIRSLKGEHTVILSTHILQEVTAVCDKVTIIKNGRVAVSDSIERLSDSNGSNRCNIKIRGNKNEAERVLAGIKNLEVFYNGTDRDDLCDFDVLAMRDIREELFFAFSQAKLPILELKRDNSSIEELFAKVTSSEDTIADNGGKK